MAKEQLSPHEILARKFEHLQKKYFDEVRAVFMTEQWLYGPTAFSNWEKEFLPVLTNEAPSLLASYKRNVQESTLYWGDKSDVGWKSGKGGAIESFLDWAILRARAQKLIPILEPIYPPSAGPVRAKPKSGGKIFIGHGRSPMWRELKDFIQDRLHLKWDEFNREPTAGYTTVERLEKMLEEARFAFLVMTAEDEHSDTKLHARQNVIHEVGLFQGKLGFKKAIILLEEGCEKFSNIEGLTYISFPKGNIEAAFERIRGVLEREGIVK